MEKGELPAETRSQLVNILNELSRTNDIRRTVALDEGFLEIYSLAKRQNFDTSPFDEDHEAICKRRIAYTNLDKVPPFLGLVKIYRN